MVSTYTESSNPWSDGDGDGDDDDDDADHRSPSPSRTRDDDSNSNNPHDKTPWGPRLLLAYTSPFGGRQQSDRNSIRRLRLGPSAIIQGCRDTTRSHPTSRGYAAPSPSAGGVQSAGRLRHHTRSSMLNNGGGGMDEVLCDQCGDVFFHGQYSSTRSLPPFRSLDPPLAVCGAPGCGVSFSQCARCKEEYAGCCSAACQALAAGQEPASVAAASPRTSGGEGRRVEQRLNGGDGDGEGLASLGVAGSSSFGQAGVFRPKGVTALSAARASSSEQEPARSDRVGEKCGDLSRPESAEARGAGRERRKRVEEEVDEGLLESYASRHSEPESPCLAAVREGTNR